jgi:hypothetical protein
VVERQSDMFLSAPAFREEDLESICTVLQKQREGLQHLSDIVRFDVLRRFFSCFIFGTGKTPEMLI